MRFTSKHSPEGESTGSQCVARVLLVLVLCIASVANAQWSPTRPVRILVPFPPGGIADTLARAMGQQMSQSLKTSVVIENRTGASTSIAGREVARAEPDGYTLYVTPTTHVLAPYLLPSVPFDPVSDFTPLTQIVRTHALLVAGAPTPFSTLPELVAYARANPGKLNIGSWSVGSTSHVFAETLRTNAGIDIVHIAHQGSAGAVTAILAGNIQLLFDSPLTLSPHLKSGRIKAIAFATEKRIPTMPEVPTLGEFGVKDIDIDGWIGVFGPKGMQPALAAAIGSELARAIRSKEVSELIERGGIQMVAGTPAEFATIVRRDYEAWGRLIKQSGIKFQ